MMKLVDADQAWSRLAAYLAGEDTHEERAAFETWVQASPAREAVLRRARDQWRRGAEPATADLPRAWKILQQRMDRQTAQERTRGRPSRRIMWYAAVSIMIASVGIMMGRRSATHRLGEPAVRTVSTYATTNGERATITLLDGTTVALNVASRLDVPADFAIGNHTVRLTGEALFNVSHRTQTPFTVLAGSATTRVLGTTFSVRHYTTDSSTTVTVQEGKVAVGSTVVTEQRLVEVGRHGISALRPAPAGAFSFATGTLSLGYMRLIDAIPELNRWFDVDVRLGDTTLAAQQFHGDFAAGSVADLTNILTLAFDVRVVREGRVLTLYPGSPK